MSFDYDAIIIGSGMGALSAASLLSQLRGQRVLVLEKHFKVGGFTHTFSRHGYKFDVGLHYVGEMQPGSRSRQLFDLVSGGGVDWAPLPEIYDKFVYPDFTVSASSNRAAYIEELQRRFPHERAAILQYFKDIDAVCLSVQTKTAAGFMPKLIAGPVNALNSTFRKMAVVSTADYLNANFKDAKLKAVLVSQWGDYGLPPSLSSFAIHALIATHFLKGAFYPIGSADAIAQSIVPIIKRAGGNVLVNHGVDEIVVKNGVACGVSGKTQNGEPFSFSARHIISNAGIYPTFRKLLPDLYKAPVLGFSDDLDASSISAYIGFKRSPSELGFQGENHWLHTSYDHDAEYAARNNPEGKPGFAYLSFASLKDALAEKHTAQVITIASAAPFRHWQNTAWKKRGSDYEIYKERLTENLLSVIETHYPGFRDLIDYCELSTPLTVESFTGHPAGRIYGQPMTPQVVAARSFQPDTHVKNLYLAGADSMAPGIMGAFMGGVFCAARIMGAFGLAEIMTTASSRKYTAVGKVEAAGRPAKPESLPVP
ncbi:MAG: NAD(P)/FAD-dependent oxidoreductase [Candidatus Obscuribacter phosphatis]|uniref:NAD(P)/FAD-dependent oxidoreductase n=1 Tax=Candidatus Obscuribacter phosphatis TaxID=1906157 RepID=A0A8J7PH99_9BACT|nr:NAD(P)/FAD-dependent oxidoreductase [Candidatus Obscuribacter phosphatis]